MSGMLEAWGRGFDKIKAGCEIYAGPLPEYDTIPVGLWYFAMPAIDI